MEYRDIVLQVVAVVVLVGLAGILVAAEVALTRVSRRYRLSGTSAPAKGSFSFTRQPAC